MASPVGEREARLERPLRVGLILLPAALALTAMVLTACGGGGGADDGAKVEASLQHYLSTLDPEQSLGPQTRPAVGVFPVGAGPPRVRENSCKKIHTGKVRPARTGKVRPARLPEGLSGWSCVVTFGNGKSALPVAVAVKGSGEVYWAAPVGGPALPPATVYEGGP